MASLRGAPVRPASLRPASLRRAGWPLLCAVVIGLAAPGCSGAPGRQAAQVRHAGDLQVEGADGWTIAVDGDAVRAGTQVRTGEEEARLALAGGALWLAPGTGVTVHAGHVELRHGEALAEAERELTVTWDTAEVRGTGVFRMRLGSAPHLGVYRGEVAVRRPGEETTVPALRQVVLRDRRLGAVMPLHYRGQDAWDSKWMDQALHLDGEVERLGHGIERAYGTDPRPTAFYAQFVPEVELELLTRAARARDQAGGFGPPADVLLPLFLARSGLAEPVGKAMRTVLALREQGARWGLIGVELEVAADRLAAVVDLGHARQVAIENLAEPEHRPAAGSGRPAAPPPTTGAPGAPEPEPAPPATGDFGGGDRSEDDGSDAPDEPPRAAGDAVESLVEGLGRMLDNLTSP